MARINPKTGLPYVKNVKFSEQDKWKVTVKELYERIRIDPDLKKHEKTEAIRKLTTRLDELMQENGFKERLALLNKLYAKGFGTTANHNTPMADFIREIILRRGKS